MLYVGTPGANRLNAEFTRCKGSLTSDQPRAPRLRPAGRFEPGEHPRYLPGAAVDRRSESGEQVGLGDTRALPIADEPFGAEGVPETVFGHGQEE
jgi:hypothetical protein